jgi:hypothetical protein
MVEDTDQTDALVEDRSMAFPCPNCGSEYLTQNFRSSETVHVDDEGQIVWFDKHDAHEPISVFCEECDTLLWEGDE